MSSLAVIPARMESSRFFGKPLAHIAGIPMITHCYERALLCRVTLNEIEGMVQNVGGRQVDAEGWWLGGGMGPRHLPPLPTD